MWITHMSNGHDLWYGRFEDQKLTVTISFKVLKGTISSSGYFVTIILPK